MSLQSTRFAGDPVLQACLAGRHRMMAGEVGNAVGKIQQALIDLGYLISDGATGNFAAQTAAAVVKFKTDKRLQPNDPVVGPGTMRALDADIIEFDLRRGNSAPAPGPVAPTPAPAPGPPSAVANHKFVGGGLWTGSANVAMQGGQSMTFVLTNTSLLGTTISIAASNGQNQSVVLLPAQTMQLNFSTFGREPMGWTFSVSTLSSAFAVAWQLWSTWAPGDPPNG